MLEERLEKDEALEISRGLEPAADEGKRNIFIEYISKHLEKERNGIYF